MKSLSHKLTVLVLLITMVGMLLIGGVSVFLVRDSLLDESLGRVSQNTAREAERINSWLESQSAYLTAAAVDLTLLEDFTTASLLQRLQAHNDDHTEYFDFYFGYPDGTMTYASGFVPDYSSGWRSTDRPWYQGALAAGDGTYITVPYTDTQTGDLCISMAKSVYHNGVLTGVLGADIDMQYLEGIIGETDVGNNSYAFLTDTQGNLLVHPNDSYGPVNDTYQNLGQIENGLFAEVLAHCQEDDAVYKQTGVDGTKRYYVAHAVGATGWRLYTALPSGGVTASILRMVGAYCVLLLLVLGVAGGLISLTVRRVIMRPVKEITTAAQVLAQGGLDIKLERHSQDEMGQMADSFAEMATCFRQQAETIRRIAEGDLRVEVPIQSAEDVVGQALQQLLDNLNQSISSIAQASENVSSGAEQISGNAQHLASGTSDQATSIRTLTTSITEIHNKINMNEQRTEQTHLVSYEISQSAQLGAGHMQRMIQAVEEINEASSRISHVIKVIDDIAFQTNILSLNAAVEAARAGQHGKGFAVVADQVRMLAGRSAEAAKQTTAMISDSIEKANEGCRIAQETSESMQVILDGIGKTAQLTDEINSATKEQAAEIAKINARIAQISEVVSTTAAASEESAASARELSNEAVRLASVVQRFQTVEHLSGSSAGAARLHEPQRY